eukprot:CAMPEP_0171087454 /NCGR_PEP_ID=MMETSP0766_2-20121228/20156_1 /TAXON_ID=439317 /ORGANISM="Gambierdiscus australes, Strain CAWD 149" /LENGTH=112 /DNA_ID=CAMNT_0011545155 /DNA_START=20 /DNA_END=355 /DNA_ORIENTATION=+
MAATQTFTAATVVFSMASPHTSVESHVLADDLQENERWEAFLDSVGDDDETQEEVDFVSSFIVEELIPRLHEALDKEEEILTLFGEEEIRKEIVLARVEAEMQEVLNRQSSM